MRNLILDLDHWLFLKINHDWAHPYLDPFFVGLTNIIKHQWFVAGVLPALLVTLIIWRRKEALQVIASIAITVAICDFTSYKVFKSIFNRDRPHYTELGAIVRVPYAPTSKSFPSNHTFNSFAIANILAYYWPALSPLFWLYAILMAYSRVYVGVHYPLDIIAGMLLGIIFAIGIRKYLLLRLPWFERKITKEKK